MPVAKVRLEDGRIAKFRVPDGTSQEEVMAMVQAQLHHDPADEDEPVREDESGWEDFGEGVGASVLDTWYGVKDLFTDLSAEDLATLQDWKDDAAQSGWGTAGRVVGELGQLALPGSAGLKAARALNAAGKMAKTAKALPLATDVAASAGLGALQLPDEGATRGQEAFQGGLAALGGGLAGRAIAPFIRGVKGTKATEALRESGVQLTPGQMKGGVLRSMENFGEYLAPSLSRAIQGAKQTAKESLEIGAMRKYAPPTPDTILKPTNQLTLAKPNKPGFEGIAQLQKAFDDAYEKAWGAGTDIPSNLIDELEKVLNAKSAVLSMPKSIGDVAKRALKDVKLNVKAGNKLTPKDVDGILRASVHGKSKYAKSDEIINAMRDRVRSLLPKENKRALKRLDSRYPALVALEDSARKAILKRGQFGRNQLADSIKSGSGRKKGGSGKALLSNYVADWDELVGKPPGMLMTTSRRFVQQFPEIPGMRSLGRQLAGTNKRQERIREALQKEWANRLRNMSSTARAGGAYEGDY